MKKIRVAIAGVGNCASSLVQGLEYYKGRTEGAFAGLMHPRIGDWGPSDIKVVAAFDIDRLLVRGAKCLGIGIVGHVWRDAVENRPHLHHDL